MGRPKTIVMSAEQQDRHDRLTDAIRWARITAGNLADRIGSSSTSVWRWVSRGDPVQRASHGVSPSAESIAQACGIEKKYMVYGGPRLWPDAVERPKVVIPSAADIPPARLVRGPLSPIAWERVS